MCRVVYVTRSEVIHELEQDLERYKRHLMIDIQDPIANDIRLIEGVRVIKNTWEELRRYKNE